MVHEFHILYQYRKILETAAIKGIRVLEKIFLNWMFRQI